MIYYLCVLVECHCLECYCFCKNLIFLFSFFMNIFEYRFPLSSNKIRLDTIIGDYSRFVVRIDSWEIHSLYPNGHFVRSLGPAGNLETEISSILMEHGLSVGPFTENILKEMPVNSSENRWQMKDDEVSRRRDLRWTFLNPVFFF